MECVFTLNFDFLPKNFFNFDGSYLQSSCRRGIGGFIRGCNGNVIRSFFGPLNSLNADKAEVYALLIGYHELLRLGGYNVIIEGDSFSAIQWGSRKATASWRLVDGMEEV